METMDVGTIINVRLFTYKSFRHYGGREITTMDHICKASFIEVQRDHSVLVGLLEDCANFKKGHKIAITENNFNV